MRNVFAPTNTIDTMVTTIANKNLFIFDSTYIHPSNSSDSAPYLLRPHIRAENYSEYEWKNQLFSPFDLRFIACCDYGGKNLDVE